MIFGFSFSYMEDITGSSLDVLTHTALHADRRIPRTSLVSLHTQPSWQSGGSQGYPRILTGCLPTHSPPGSLEYPKGIPGSSLDAPPHPALQAVWRIPRASRDPPWMSSPPGSLEDPKTSQDSP